MFLCRINTDNLCSLTPGHQAIYTCEPGDSCNNGPLGRCIPHTPPAP
jgi:hypothetical protein